MNIDKLFSVLQSIL